MCLVRLQLNSSCMRWRTGRSRARRARSRAAWRRPRRWSTWTCKAPRTRSGRRVCSKRATCGAHSQVYVLTHSSRAARFSSDCTGAHRPRSRWWCDSGRPMPSRRSLYALPSRRLTAAAFSFRMRRCRLPAGVSSLSRGRIEIGIGDGACVSSM